MMKPLAILAALTVVAVSALRDPATTGHSRTSAPIDVQNATRCCEGPCNTTGTKKYYSIAQSLKGTWHCGECCIKPSSYWLFHIFEKNLTEAATPSPCASFGYTRYEETVTHGFPPIAVTLDLYDCGASGSCVTQPPTTMEG